MHKILRQMAIVFGCTSAATHAIAAEAPRRVVSLNLCTDQLAMLLAQPGQLHSVSFLASDPKSSVLYQEAKAYPLNRGQAEEIFLMKPDLILAGSYTTRSTVQMLKRLGYQVEEFAPDNSINDVKSSIRRMGTLLRNDEKAEQMVNEIEARLSRLDKPKLKKATGAFYYSNSYTSGSGTLVADMARLAGISNLGEELGLYGTAYLSLEQLLLAKPDLLVVNEVSEERPALAQQNFKHPAYRQLLGNAASVSIDGRLTACGTPYTIDAIEALNAAAMQITGAKAP